MFIYLTNAPSSSLNLGSIIKQAELLHNDVLLSQS